MWRMPATEREWAHLRAMSHLDDESADDSEHDSDIKPGSAVPQATPGAAGGGTAPREGLWSWLVPPQARLSPAAGSADAQTATRARHAADSSAAAPATRVTTAGAAGRHARQQARLLATSRERQQRRRAKQRRLLSARLASATGPARKAIDPAADLADDVDALAMCLQSFASVAAQA